MSEDKAKQYNNTKKSEFWEDVWCEQSNNKTILVGLGWGQGQGQHCDKHQVQDMVQGQSTSVLERTFLSEHL